MIDSERAKHIGDVIVAPGAGAAGLLAQAADMAGKLTPILTALMLGLTCAWYAWRMVDRWRYGPSQTRDRDDE